MSDERIRRILKDLVGETALFWSPRPDRAGFSFDADAANRAVDDAMAEMKTDRGEKAATHDEHGASCYDCNRPYGHEHGFPDLIIPYRVWREITPTQDDGGLLCPSCICKRLHERGLRCEGAFMSGPISSVSRDTMDIFRRVENIELAIEGRDNRWAGVRELVTGEAHPEADIIHGRTICTFCHISSYVRDWHGAACPNCGRRAPWAAPEVPA